MKNWRGGGGGEIIARKELGNSLRDELQRQNRISIAAWLTNEKRTAENGRDPLKNWLIWTPVQLSYVLSRVVVFIFWLHLNHQRTEFIQFF